MKLLQHYVIEAKLKEARSKTDNYYLYILRKSKKQEIRYVGIPIDDWQVVDGYYVVPKSIPVEIDGEIHGSDEDETSSSELKSE